MLITTILLAILSRPLGAHFLLNAPPTLGFDDDNEGEAPCGGFDVDFDKGKVTDFHVGGDAIAVRSTHPEANWLFRATMEEDAKGNWTNLLPVVSQTGLGNYCEKDLMLPSLWAGSRGVLQIVQHGPDSTLYQVSSRFVLENGKFLLTCMVAVRSGQLRQRLRTRAVCLPERHRSQRELRLRLRPSYVSNRDRNSYVNGLVRSLRDRLVQGFQFGVHGVCDCISCNDQQSGDGFAPKQCWSGQDARVVDLGLGGNRCFRTIAEGLSVYNTAKTHRVR